MKPTFAYIRECFSVDRENGGLVWKERPDGHFSSVLRAKAWNKRFAGTSAGRIFNGGRRKVSINDRLYFTSRVIFALCHGVGLDQLDGIVDHKNGDITDERPSNLRLCTISENNRNSRPRSSTSSGVKGVYWNAARSVWAVRISLDGERHFLGNFHELADAREAYASAASVMHGEFARF